MIGGGWRGVGLIRSWRILWTAASQSAVLAAWLQTGCAVSPPTGYVPAREILPGKGEKHDEDETRYGFAASD